MKAYDVIGYAYDGAVYCPDHRPAGDDDEVSPIFAGDEGIEDDTCDECGERLIEED